MAPKGRTTRALAPSLAVMARAFGLAGN
jgi:hypothetical protein